MKASNEHNSEIGDCKKGFKEYIFKNASHKVFLRIALIAIIVQFSLFKYFYPYASFIHGDSFAYLDTAYRNVPINTYMIGYSMFLRLFSVFTASDTILVAFQFLQLQLSMHVLLMTVFYFYNPSRVTQRILQYFMLFNPLFLFMGNLISSDGLFLTLSVVWFTLLIWIIHAPTFRIFFWHAVVLYLAFTVRYNALIYLPISCLAFGLSKQPLLRKVSGMLAASIPLVLFILFTGAQYKTLTGNWQYSPFAGWQMANNAMYAYRYVDSAHRKPVPQRFRKLDNMVRAYFDSTRDIRKNPQEALMASTVYMWDPRLTLWKYCGGLFKKDTAAGDELKRWASMGPLYKDYGSCIIKLYPGYYLRYFIWPNANKYYAPPVEFLSSFNSGANFVAPIAMIWFRYKGLQVKTRTHTLDNHLLDFYPILSGIINVLMLFCLIFYGSLGGWRIKGRLREGILLAGIFWILNAGFTIFASSAALRFQSFPILLTLLWVGMLVDWLWKMASAKSEEKLETVNQIAVSI